MCIIFKTIFLCCVLFPSTQCFVPSIENRSLLRTQRGFEKAQFPRTYARYKMQDSDPEDKTMFTMAITTSQGLGLLLAASLFMNFYQITHSSRRVQKYLSDYTQTSGEGLNQLKNEIEGLSQVSVDTSSIQIALDAINNRLNVLTAVITVGMLVGFLGVARWQDEISGLREDKTEAQLIDDPTVAISDGLISTDPTSNLGCHI